MNCRSIVRVLLGVLLFSSMTLGSSARAAVERDVNVVEVFGGLYQPGPSILEDGSILGFRLGRAFGRQYGVYGELSFVRTDGEVDTGGIPGVVDVDYDLTFVEAIFAYYFNQHSLAAVSVFGGGGFSFASVDVSVSNMFVDETIENIEDNSLTVQAGADVTITLSERVYLRPGVRARWLEQRDNDAIDTEVFLGLGFTLGR